MVERLQKESILERINRIEQQNYSERLEDRKDRITAWKDWKQQKKLIQIKILEEEEWDKRMWNNV